MESGRDGGRDWGDEGMKRMESGRGGIEVGGAEGMTGQGRKGGTLGVEGEGKERLMGERLGVEKREFDG